MAKSKNSNENKTVAFLPLNTPIIIRAFHKVSGEQFDKKATYSEWLEFKKHKDYRYIALQVI
jgi:hypothetical protein